MSLHDYTTVSPRQGKNSLDGASWFPISKELHQGITRIFFSEKPLDCFPRFAMPLL